MIDRLEDIKKHHGIQVAPGIIEVKTDNFRWLIAEVERLRSDIKLFEAMRNGVGERIESLQKERDTLKRYLSDAGLRIVQDNKKLEAENAHLIRLRDSADRTLLQAGMDMRELQEKLAASEKAREDAEERAERYRKQIMSGDVDGKGRM